MKKFLRSLSFIATLGALALGATPAHAIGCLSGAAAGAVAGHVAGHHAVIGALGGCFAGHELAVKEKREAEANKLIADYDTAPTDSPRRAHDLAGIDKLARDHVPLAVKWEQEHNVHPQ